MRIRNVLLAISALGFATYWLYGYFTEPASTSPTTASVPRLTTQEPSESALRVGGSPPPLVIAVPPAAYAAGPSARSDSIASFPREHDSVMALRLEGPQAIRVGERFSVSVSANAYTPVGRYLLVLSFDPAMLNSVNASAGDFMQLGSALAKYTENAATSHGELVIGAEQDGGAGVEGAGSVAVVQLEAISAGSARIEFKSVEAYDGDGKTVAVQVPAPLVLTINK